MFRFLHLLRLRRQVGIEGEECGRIHGFRQESQRGEKLAAFIGQRVEARFEDVIAPLDQIEVSQVELAATRRIVGPSIETPSILEVIVDETSQDSDDQRMAIAVFREVVLNRPGVAPDTTRAEKLFRVRGTQAGKGDALNARDGLTCRIQQDTRHQPELDKHLGRSDGSEAE